MSVHKIGRILAAVGVLWSLGACTDSEGSITLVFPNEVARSVIRRLRVEAYSPDSGGTGLSDRSCVDFLGEARTGNDPLGTPARGEYQCPEPCEDGWFANDELAKVPGGQQIIYVLAYASNEVGQMPILEGCTDRFDSTEENGSFENVEVRLEFVVPNNARLVKVRGDRQVGRADSTLGVPLSVEVRADAPISGGAYVIPGVPVEFTSETPGFDVVGGTNVIVPAAADGQARAQVELPGQAGTGTIRARSATLENIPNATPEVRFSVSVTPPTAFAATEAIARPGGRPVGLMLGDLDGTGPLDLAALTCDGSEEQCELAASVPSPGPAGLWVVRNAGDAGSRRILSPGASVGVLPTDIKLVDMVEPQGVSEIAVLNARRQDCQSRVCPASGDCECFAAAPGEPCPCEGSEVRMFDVAQDATTLRSAFTMTASNGIAMTVVDNISSNGFDGVVVAARGRMRNDRPCSRNNTCQLPNPTIDAESAFCQSNPMMCGCPPNEFCECDDCSLDSSVGFCRANDKTLDLLAVRSGGREDIYNRGGCQQWVGRCGGPADNQVCDCLDSAERGGVCNASDACGCTVPNAIRIGELSAPVVPLGVTAGVLRPGEAQDLVIPSIGGLGLARSGQDRPFDFQGIPVVNAPVHQAVVVPLDEASEREMALTSIAPDVVWIARAPCTVGFRDACPSVNANPEDADLRGCLGAYYTDGEPSVFRLVPPSAGGCRRHELTFVPDGLCAGRFNTDEHIDIAVASKALSEVLVFSGDGRGGLLDPPERFSLPSAGGGPLACGDLDGDDRDDIAVFSTDASGQATGVILLKTRP